MFRNVFKIDIFSPSSHLLLNQCLSGIDLFTANRLAKSPSNTPDTRMFTIREGTAMWVKTGSCPLDALYRNLFSASLNGHVGHSFAWSTSTKRGKLEKIVLLKEFTIQKYTPWLCWRIPSSCWQCSSGSESINVQQINYVGLFVYKVNFLLALLVKNRGYCHIDRNYIAIKSRHLCKFC